MINLESSILKDSLGILFYCPSGTSTNAIVGKRLLYHLFKQKPTITWYPVKYDETLDNESDVVYQNVKSLINLNIEFDSAVFVCNPNEWFEHVEKFKIKFNKKKLIGYLRLEQSKMPDGWVDQINILNEVWVNCNTHKEICERYGVFVPIKVVKLDRIDGDLNNTDVKLNSGWYYEELFNGKSIRYASAESTINFDCGRFDTVILKVKYEFGNSEKVINVLIDSKFKRSYTLKKDVEQNIIIPITNVFGLKIESPSYRESEKRILGFQLLNIALHSKSEIKEYSIDQIKVENELTREACKDDQSILLGDVDLNYKPLLKKGWHKIEIENEDDYFIWSSGNSELYLGEHTFQMLRVVMSLDPEEVLDRSVTIKKDNGEEETFEVKKFINNKKYFIDVKIENVRQISLIPSDVFCPNQLNPFVNDDRMLGFRIVGFIFYAKSKKPLILKIKRLTEIEKEENHKKELEEQEVLNERNSECKFDLVTLNSVPHKYSKGILYIGQYGTSGYASAAKGYLCDFVFRDIPVTWQPLYFDDSEMSDDFYGIIAKSLIGKKTKDYQTVILHCTPDLWVDTMRNNKDNFKNKKVIGYTVWETSKLPSKWVEAINNSVHEVWCPSTYNENVFKTSGVNIPIKVVPHVFLKRNLPSKETVELYSYKKELITTNDCYTFYNISEMNIRKGVEDLVNVFCESFTKEDKVRLILKVHFKDYSDENKTYCIEKLKAITDQFGNPPTIHLILNNLSDTQVLALHSIGDCYISLCKSEGFGLTIFDAYNYGKKVIATGYGGHIDYLGEKYKGLIKYKLGKVEGMNNFSTIYTEDQEWAYPDLKHAIRLIKKHKK